MNKSESYAFIGLVLAIALGVIGSTLTITSQNKTYARQGLEQCSIRTPNGHDDIIWVKDCIKYKKITGQIKTRE